MRLDGDPVAHAEEMADLITAEMGSPRTFSRLGQANGALSQMYLTLATAKEFGWVERRPGLFGEVQVRRAPVGVVGAIVPWNVPQVLIMPKMIPALIAGCTVVVKPAPETPLDAMWLAEMLDELDLPEGVVSIVPGGSETGESPRSSSRRRQDRVHRILGHRQAHRRGVR